MNSKPLFQSYRQSECLQFFVDVVSTCQKSNIETLGVKPQVDALQAKTTALENNFKQERGSAITEVLIQLDNARDNDVSLLKKVAVAYSNHFTPEKSAAAKSLLRNINKYGNHIYKMNLQEETTSLKNLGHDLKTDPKLVAAIALLGLDDVVDHMINTNELFNQRYLNRIEDVADVAGGNNAKLIQEAILLYKTFDSHMEAHSILSPSVNLDLLNGRLDELIRKFNATVSMRKSKTDEELTPKEV